MSGKVITIRDPDVDLIRNIKIATGRATASQAFISAAELALAQADQIHAMRQEIATLHEMVGVYKRTLDDAHGAAVRLAEIAGQDDLLLPSENPLHPAYRSGRR